MPRKLEIDALKADLAAVTSLIEAAEKYKDPVGKYQYQLRKDEIESAISSLNDQNIPLASVAIFFGGKPVLGSRGIAAGFAGKSLNNFQDIFSTQFAKTELGQLGERGKIPHASSSSLMVTGVTMGSFGFLLEELSDQNILFDTTLKEMVHEVITIIQSISGSDEIAFEESLEKIDTRMQSALKNFFNDLESNKATVRLVDDQKDLSMDEDAISRAKRRIENTDIRESEVAITGLLKGLLPLHRRFELLSEEFSEISGTIVKEAVEQFDSSISKGTNPIYKKCSAKAVVRTVKPLNRPERKVYKILEFTSLGVEDA